MGDEFIERFKLVESIFEQGDGLIKVSEALSNGYVFVALESTVISHVNSAIMIFTTKNYGF